MACDEITYDEFESTMKAAGWSMDEIEAAWQEDLRRLEEINRIASGMIFAA